MDGCPSNPRVYSRTGTGDGIREKNTLTRRSHSGNALPLLMLGASVGMLAVALRSARTREATLRSALNEVRGELMVARRNESGYRTVLQSQVIPTGALHGIAVGNSQRSVTVAADSAVILYVVESSCAACELNYEFLREIEARAPGSVVAVSLRDPADVLARYALARKLNFPVVAQPKGPLLALIPRHGTPITLVARNHHLVAIMPGRLSTDQRAAIRRSFGVQYGPGDSPFDEAK